MPGGMPLDLAQVAAKRVGIIGLLYSTGYFAFEMLFFFTRAAKTPALMPYFIRNAAVGIVAGLALYRVSRKWANQPERVIQWGLVFEVLASLHISMAETALPFSSSALLRGHSAIAFWISTFALVAPAPYGQALTAALLSAAMAPLGILLNHFWRGNPLPPLEIWAIWSAAPFLMAVLCTWIAKWIYQLGVELEQARNLGSYQLLEPVGEGGMGEVWKAKHRYLARDAAVKLIGSKGKNAGEMRRRFEREAQVVARLECPHTVSIFDFGATPEGQLYFAMELIRGLNLDQLVKRFGPQPQERVRHILMAVLRSLEEAHAAGLVHRDIKPSNILLGRIGLEHDFVKVVDFGLVKIEAEEGITQLTLDQQALGTPSFMAPEVAQGDETRIDHRVDLYALGCVAYWLLTGRNVFSGPTPMAILLKHLQEPVEAPRMLSEMPIDGEMEAVVLRALEKKPEDRFPNAGEMRRVLEEIRLGKQWDGRAAGEWWRTNLPGLA